MKTTIRNIHSNKVLFGYIMVILSAIGFGSYGVWSKNIGGDFGVYTQGWVRSVIVLILLIPVGVITKQFKKIDRKDWKWLSVPIIFGIFTQAPLYYAFNNMSIGTATLIFFSLFLITSYFFGYFFMGEKLTTVKVVSLVLAIAGLIATFGIELGVFSLLALMLAAINGVASGGEVASTKIATKKYSSFQVSTLIWAGIVITHIPAAVLSGESFVPIQFNTVWASMVAYSLIGLASFWFVIEGFRHIDASIGGLLGLLEVIFAILFGILIFNETLTTSTVIGGTMILSAAILPDVYNLVKRRKVQTSTIKEEAVR